MNFVTIYKCPFYGVCFERDRAPRCYDSLIIDETGNNVCRIDVDPLVIRNNEELKNSLKRFKVNNK